MVEAGERLQQIPSRVGTWEMRASDRLSETARTMLECTGDIVGNYENWTTKETVALTLIVGPAGTVSVHSPEVCFPSQSYRLINERRLIKIRDGALVDHQFWLAEFRSQDAEAQLIRVYYAWSTGGSWSAPVDARIEFAGSPYLYKLQLVGIATPGTQQQLEDPVTTFLRVFLPEVKGEIVGPVSVP
jgi:hypothetical protein